MPSDPYTTDFLQAEVHRPIVVASHEYAVENSGLSECLYCLW